MKRLFFWIILLTAVAGAASAIRLAINSRKPLPSAELATEPPSSPFKDSIGARGLVESVNENVHIAPAIAGLVEDVKAEVGKRVTAGDTLIVQDGREARAVIAAQEAEIAALQAQLAEAGFALAEKRDMWTRMEKLIAGRVASDEEKQRALFATQAAEAQVGSVKARIASATALLERAKVQLDLLTTRAPRDGHILQVDIRKGEFASPADTKTMIILGDTEHFQLRADVDESDASYVTAKMTAIAFVRGRREISIPLTFVRFEPYIVPKKSLTGASTERVDTRVLQIIYKFDKPAEKPNEPIGVYVGQQMDVFINRTPGGQ